MNPATMHDHGGHVPQPRRQHHYDVPDTPEAREHAEEAEALRKDLDDLGIGAEQVSPSRDGRGHVRMNFDQLAKALGLIDDRDDEIARLKERVRDLQEQLDRITGM
jgi:hypothetical protein